MAVSYNPAGSGVSGQSTSPESLTVTPNIADIIIVMVCWNNTSDTPNISDGVNAYSSLFSKVTNSGGGAGGSQSIQAFQAVSKSNTILTVLVSGLTIGTLNSLLVVSYAGLSTSSDPVTTVGSNTGITGSTLTSATVTTTNNLDLLLGFFFCANATSITSTWGTIRQTNSFCGAIVELVTSSSGSYQASATTNTSGSQNWEAKIAGLQLANLPNSAEAITADYQVGGGFGF